MQATGAQEREIMRVKRDPDKQSELWATCPCDCLQEMSLQKKRGPECAVRVFGRRGVGLPVQKRRRVTRAGVAEELSKSKKKNEVTEAGAR